MRCVTYNEIFLIFGIHTAIQINFECFYVRLAIIIPAYEPNVVLVKLLEDLSALYDNIEGHIDYIIVDDGSLSKTSKEVFQKIDNIPNAIVLKHQENKDKCAALKTAIQYAVSNKIDLVITADADGQHTAQDIKNVGDHSIKYQNFTIGSRDFKGDIPQKAILEM